MAANALACCQQVNVDGCVHFLIIMFCVAVIWDKKKITDEMGEDCSIQSAQYLQCTSVDRRCSCLIDGAYNHYCWLLTHSEINSNPSQSNTAALARCVISGLSINDVMMNVRFFRVLISDKPV